MKQVLTLFAMLLTVASTYAQQPLNGSFEDWSSNVLFDNPDDWNTSNFWAWPSGTQVVLRSVDAHGGSFAARLNVIEFDEDTIAGLVMNSGSIEGDDSLTFTGGFPITTMPDSIAGWFQMDIATGDTALVAVLFKNNGIINGINMLPLTGTQSGYVRIAWALEALGTPDECIVAVTASSPESANPNSWVMVDDLTFVGSTDPIPNGDFEDWTELTYNDPDGWSSSNFFSVLFGGTPAVTESTDAHDGNSSVRIETQEIQFDQGEPAQHVGYLSNGQPGDFGFSSGQPYNDQPLELSGWYKYTPAPNSSDSAWLVLQFSQWDANLQFAQEVFSSGLGLPAAAAWTEFTIDIDYDTTMSIDSMLIVMASSTHIFEDSAISPLGSVLLLDELSITSVCGYTQTLELFAVADTTICDSASLMLDAGTASSYAWSNGSTTQTIQVSDSGTYSCMVVFDDGCEAADAIDVHVVICSFVDDLPLAARFTAFPNPARSWFYVETAENTQGTLTIYNSTGSLVATHRIAAPMQHIPLEGVTSGMYFLKLSTPQGETVRKLLVE